MGSSLLRWIVNEIDAFVDATLETSLARFEKLLLVFADLTKDITSLFGTVGLVTISQSYVENNSEIGLTPSSTGTEKKSTPVSFAITSPPGTPGR